MKKSLIIIDSHALLYRFFFALPPLTNHKGEPSGAIYGLSAVLLKIIKEQRPDYMLGVFDTPEATFREEIFPDYKGQRPKMGDDLIPQIERAHELYNQFGIKTLERPGFEADDVIGSVANKFKGEKDLVVIILSGDLDMLQLVEDDKVVVQFVKKGVSETVIYNEKAVIERYEGLTPKQLPDLKALLGDSSDNFPGVRGVGPKTAIPLIKKAGSLENLLDNLWEAPEKVAAKIEAEKDKAIMCKKLAKIKTDLDLDLKLEELALDFKKQEVKSFFEQNNFNSLSNRLDLM